MYLDFSVEVTNRGGIPVVRVCGEIDIYTCSKLDQSLREVVDRGRGTIVLNLEKVQYIDSTGLGAIAYSAVSMSKEGGQIHIVCNKPQVKRIFDISGLSKKNVSLYDDEDAALVKGARSG